MRVGCTVVVKPLGFSAHNNEIGRIDVKFRRQLLRVVPAMAAFAFSAALEASRRTPTSRIVTTIPCR
jgi:hypothetical protein